MKHTATGRVGEVVDAADEKGNHMVVFTEVGPGAKVVQKFANMNRLTPCSPAQTDSPSSDSSSNTPPACFPQYNLLYASIKVPIRPSDTLPPCFPPNNLPSASRNIPMQPSNTPPTCFHPNNLPSASKKIPGKPCYSPPAESLPNSSSTVPHDAYSS